MRELTFTKTFDDLVFSDDRSDKFWCLMTSVVKDGKLLRVETIWNFHPQRPLNKWREYLSWASACFAEMIVEYGYDEVMAAEIKADALSWENVNEEIARKLKEQGLQKPD